MDDLSDPPTRGQVQEAMVTIVQGMYHQVHQKRIWEDQARALIAKFYTEAALLKRIKTLAPAWIQRYLEQDEEWYVHRDYHHFQATAKNDRWKPYACVVLKDKGPAHQMWDAVHQIAKRQKKTADEVVTDIQNAMSAVERLGEIVTDGTADS